MKHSLAEGYIHGDNTEKGEHDLRPKENETPSNLGAMPQATVKQAFGQTSLSK